MRALCEFVHFTAGTVSAAQAPQTVSAPLLRPTAAQTPARATPRAHADHQSILLARQLAPQHLPPSPYATASIPACLTVCQTNI